MKVVAFVPDLMDRSRFPRGTDVTFVRTADELAEAATDAELVIVDMSRAGAFEAIEALKDVRRIGFTNHENTELIQRANEAGVEAMARSRFFSHIALILNGEK
jgi:AmiR/NasT family two-component response regulator